MKTIELPENAELAHRVVVGIDRDPIANKRVVYVYWHGAGLPERTDWFHNEADGNILFLAQAVIDALYAANADMTVLGSSSLDFPEEV